MLLIRNALRMLRDLGGYAVDSGRWWIPAVIVLLGLAAVVAVTVKVVVPTTVYVLF